MVNNIDINVDTFVLDAVYFSLLVQFLNIFCLLPPPPNHPPTHPTPPNPVPAFLLPGNVL